MKLEGMATMFRRELGFDFPPYSADKEYDVREPTRHWLTVSDK
jgi:hypothetical protein